MKYKIKEGLVWEEIDGKIVILDPEKGKYFNLNESATEIWKCFKNSFKKSELITKISIKYTDNQRENIEKDIGKLLESLEKKQLIVTIK